MVAGVKRISAWIDGWKKSKTLLGFRVSVRVLGGKRKKKKKKKKKEEKKKKKEGGQKGGKREGACKKVQQNQNCVAAFPSVFRVLGVAP